MKSARWGLIFAMLFICIIVVDYQKTIETATIAKLQTDYDRAIDVAVEDAISGLVEKDDGRQIWINKEEAVRRFLMSLSINMNKMEDDRAKQQLCHYIPIVAVVERGRFYIGWDLANIKWQQYYFSKKYGELEVFFTLDNFVTIRNTNTKTIIEGTYEDVKHTYSLAFLREQYTFEEERRKVIVELLTEKFNEKLKEQNEIAKKYGISYEFTLPVIEIENWYRTIDDVGFLAFFQGYPYGNGYTGYYNRMALGGARLHREER